MSGWPGLHHRGSTGGRVAKTGSGHCTGARGTEALLVGKLVGSSSTYTYPDLPQRGRLVYVSYMHMRHIGICA